MPGHMKAHAHNPTRRSPRVPHRAGCFAAIAPSSSLAGAWALVLALIVALTAAPNAWATVYNSKNPNNPDNQNSPWTEDLAREVGVIEKLNSPIPLDLVFYDEQGAPIELASLFKTGRPVVINLGYSRCPSICIQMRSELTKNLGDTGLDLGEDFIILNISIDPKESPDESKRMQEQILAELADKGVRASAEDWRFLTAEQEMIDRFTAAVGYRYLYIEPQDEYGHPGVLVLADGSGVIRRYLSGTSYSPRTLRLSIVETSEGKVGSLLDRAFVTCFVWDPEANNYAATAKFIMMIGGVVIIVALGLAIIMGFAYERRRRKLLEDKETPPSAKSLDNAMPRADPA